MSIEQFSPPKKIGKLVDYLRNSNGWERLRDSKEFLHVEPVSDFGEIPTDLQLYSLLLGNPAVRLEDGKLRTTYEPKVLLDVVQALMHFRDESRGVLNAIKHGYRLPRFTDHSFETLIGQSAIDAEGADIIPEQVRKAIRSSSLVPSFWFLESDPRNRKQQDYFEGATAELRLYGVSPNLGLTYCRLVLELLKLLFDSTRNISCFGEVRSRIPVVGFHQAIQPLLHMCFPIQQPPDGNPYIISAFVPQE